MDAETKRRTRQLTGMAAALWALLAIGLSVFTLVSTRPGAQLPVRTSIIAGVAIVHAMSDEASAAGVEAGDQLISVAGVPAIEVLWAPRLALGVTDEYRLLKPDGSVLLASLEPVLAGTVEKPSDVLLHLGLLLVSAVYLLVALTVWWTRQASPDS